MGVTELPPAQATDPGSQQRLSLLICGMEPCRSKECTHGGPALGQWGGSPYVGEGESQLFGIEERGRVLPIPQTPLYPNHRDGGSHSREGTVSPCLTP